ncbi:hypothetical protein MA16_Dca021549 [Dendrobium catenatum]|uniref:Uncharacterized protein n=1 Tax=Dendrobium catenatum TaxID=906689 RepID=A0A2I0VTX6_9ASPA|nr:hypothetical protein MA16_Dca021549 [Dendrobium catenatum]
MWMLHDSFLEVVQENWNAPVFPSNSMNGMKRFWLKLKRLKQVLNLWNHKVFKNLFTNILLCEDKVLSLDNGYQLCHDNTKFNLLQEAKASLFKLQAQEEAFWKRKASAKHLVDGDNNTKYFHSFVNRKRVKNSISKIMGEDGSFMKEKEEIANFVVQHVQIRLNKVFTSSNIFNENLIPNIISQEVNALLGNHPSMDKLKEIIFDINGD